MQLLVDILEILPRLSEDDLFRYCEFHARYRPHLNDMSRLLYERLDIADRQRFLIWLLKRWGRIDLINPVEKSLYLATLQRERNQICPPVSIGSQVYQLRNFESQGHDFQLAAYDFVLGVHDVLYDQYQDAKVRLQQDDVIIDAGAFIGDTAVYFHHILQGRCQIHSFELLDENLDLLVHNLEHNHIPDDRIVINKMALTDHSGDEIVVASGPTQGATSMFGRPGAGPRVQTITLDDYVALQDLQRVDFIKMDIEGAEVSALQGARHTIRHFRPRLAICLYHKWDDPVTIPRVLESFGVPYAYSFKWVQLTDGWEAVLLARPMETASIPSVRDDGGRQQDVLLSALDTLSGAYARRYRASR